MLRVLAPQSFSPFTLHAFREVADDFVGVMFESASAKFLINFHHSFEYLFVAHALEGLVFYVAINVSG